MSHPSIEQFEALLKRDGLRLTEERRRVAQVVFSHSGPYKSEAVMKAVEAAYPQYRVSRSTVYRTLSWLARYGLIRMES